MKRNIHDEAQRLIALGGGGLSNAEQDWLRTHVEQCDACRQYAQVVTEVVRTLRSVPIAADTRLVRATQMRLRFHAGRLQQMRQRLWFTAMACLGAGLSASLTGPFLWRMVAWLGQWAGVPTFLWKAGFLFFFVLPGLVVIVLLLDLGSRLMQGGGHSPR
jgi:hypothetical protein